MCIRDRLKDNALAGAKQARIHNVVESLGEFLLVVVRVFLMMQVDVDLRLPQSAIIFLYVLFCCVFKYGRSSHERAIQNLSISELFGQVHWRAEQGCHRTVSY